MHPQLELSYDVLHDHVPQGAAELQVVKFGSLEKGRNSIVIGEKSIRLFQLFRPATL